MESCKNCSIEEKLLNCCGKNPLNGQTKRITVGNHSYTACTEFNKNGECSVYDHMPRICREYCCYKVMSMKMEAEEKEMEKFYTQRMFQGLKLKVSDIPKNSK